MSLLRKLHLIKSLLTAALAAPLLMSCYNYDHEEVEMSEISDKYINLKISVSTIDQRTRSGEKPASGENGDGREAGFERENKVDGITLVLYQGTGINAAGSTIIDFVQYFPTTKVGTAATPDTQYGDTKGVEVVYSTGDQKLKHELDMTKEYQAIVIANVNLDGTFVAGTTTLQTVRDYQFAYLHNGSASTPAV